MSRQDKTRQDKARQVMPSRPTPLDDDRIMARHIFRSEPGQSGVKLGFRVPIDSITLSWLISGDLQRHNPLIIQMQYLTW